MLQKPIKSFTSDRDGKKIEAIVIHVTDGSFESAVNTISNPKNEASYHFIVDTNGEITQFVDIKNTAWHAGRIVKPTWKKLKSGVNPNTYTIGIAFAGKGDDAKTTASRLSLCALVAKCAVDAGIRISSSTIVFHREIRSDKTCPGLNVNKNEIIKLAQMFRKNKYYDAVISKS